MNAIPLRLADKVSVSAGCWQWTACRNSKGYGKTVLDGRYVYAHRAFYELHYGRPVPEGMEIDHRCGNPGCVRPEHLQPVPRRLNLARSNSDVGQVLRTGRCKRGHEFTAANTYVAPGSGKRMCRACRDLRKAGGHR